MLKIKDNPYLVIICIVLIFDYTQGDRPSYTGCHSFDNSELTQIILYHGTYCEDAEACKRLQKCTTLFGSLVIRSTVVDAKNLRNKTLAYFPDLRELTGYLVVAFARFPTLDLFPNLTVIRGQKLLLSYAFLVFTNYELENIYFKNLTTILKGGVRIENNERLCYADSIRWKSLVKDKEQNDKYGIVVTKNNGNCGKGCYRDQCRVAPGHGNDPKAQYCWGPGNFNDNFCQKFCAEKCGLPGCVDGSINQCCHPSCLGGCSKQNSNEHCHACSKYRIQETGICVDVCPSNYVLVNDLQCEPTCPNWNQTVVSKNKVIQYKLLNGVCVTECPAGYIAEARYCVRCADENDCPRRCKMKHRLIEGEPYVGAYIKVPNDAQDLVGCTEIIGSVTLNLQEGTGSIEELTKAFESLKTIINGTLEVRHSSFKSLSFLKNLALIDPTKQQLTHGKYAFSVFGNKYLEDLWIPAQKVKITRGNVLFQFNPLLCPKRIRMLQSKFHNGTYPVKGDVSQENNGDRAQCDEVKRLTISAEEYSISPDHGLMWAIEDWEWEHINCAGFQEKCVILTWNFTRDTKGSNILFYSINYRVMDLNETPSKYLNDDCTKDENWKFSFENPPIFQAAEIGKKNQFVPMRKVIKNLKPFTNYVFLIKEIVSKGEGRTSNVVYVHTNPSIPSSPIALEANFVTSSKLRLKWFPPDEPNGIITHYNIYWFQPPYSYWDTVQGLDWCNRELLVDKPLTKDIGKENGSCPVVQKCNCTEGEEVHPLAQEDRNSRIFANSFKERFNKVIFTKPRKKGFELDTFNVATEAPEPVELGIISTTIKPFTKPDANVSSTLLEYDIEGLTYFQEYQIKVCACTAGKSGGCAVPVSIGSTTDQINCASATATTDSNKTADDIYGQPNVTILKVRDQFSIYNLTWTPPPRPNQVILKYDIAVRYEHSEDERKYCQSGFLPPHFSQKSPPGSYQIRLRAISPAGNGSWSEIVSFTIETQSLQKKNTETVVGISVAAVIVILVLVIFVVYYAFCKRNVEKGVPGVLYASVNPEYLNSSEVYIPDEWELNREKIELIRELGQGSFGMVYEGIAHDIVPGQSELRVAVKTVNENASIRDRIEFLQEASIMKAFKNAAHVVKLVGVVSQGQPTFVVMELMDRGDLKTFLRSRRPEDHGFLRPPSMQEVYHMAAEISDGMAYLAARKFVHRDLAARNCMVAVDFTVKIGDFGMARDIYETDYYRKGGKGLLPVRWMAPESLRDGLFTTASDVWSYGVVLWEIATFASQPYHGKSNEEVLRYVLNGGQLEFPETCTKRTRELMELCWQRDPKMRPSFLEIVRLLENVLENDKLEDFASTSFYHEMKKKALEDTMCQESAQEETVSRQSSMRNAPEMKDEISLSSAEFEDFDYKEPQSQTGSLKTDANLSQVPALPPRTKSPTLTLPPAFPFARPTETERSNSIYDNYGTDSDNMRYGDTPVNPVGKQQNDSEELSLSKIFYGKPVKV